MKIPNYQQLKKIKLIKMQLKLVLMINQLPMKISKFNKNLIQIKIIIREIQ